MSCDVFPGHDFVNGVCTKCGCKFPHISDETIAEVRRVSERLAKEEREREREDRDREQHVCPHCNGTGRIE